MEAQEDGTSFPVSIMSKYLGYDINNSLHKNFNGKINERWNNVDSGISM
jgi:hypothetical protein